MNKKAYRGYRSRDSYISKDPVKRQRSLDNLWQYRQGRPKREKALKEIGYYIVCPYCKKSVVNNYSNNAIESLLHFSRCKECKHFERISEPTDLMWDHQMVEIVARCNHYYAAFFTEEQLARDNESIVNELGCNYSKEKREETVCGGFKPRK